MKNRLIRNLLKLPRGIPSSSAKTSREVVSGQILDKSSRIGDWKRAMARSDSSQLLQQQMFVEGDGVGVKDEGWVALSSREMIL